MDQENQNQAQNQSSEPQATATPVASNDHEQKRMIVGILSYLSILVIVAYLMGRENPALHFHIKQGAVLFALELAITVFVSMVPFLFPIASILNIGALILAIIGIVNVVQKKDKELPLIGSFAKHVPL